MSDLDHETLHLTVVGEMYEEDSDSDEEYNDDDLHDDGYQSQICTSLSDLIKSDICSCCLYITILLVMLSCVVALAVVETKIIKPYSKGYHLISATCIPVQLIWADKDQQCL